MSRAESSQLGGEGLLEKQAVTGGHDFAAGAEMTSDGSLQRTLGAPEDTRGAWLALCWGGSKYFGFPFQVALGGDG